MLPDILPMNPYFREQIWGGRRLQETLDKDLPPETDIGESWEISAYPGMESTIASGGQAGRSLPELVKTHGADLVGSHVFDRYGDEFPLLIKLIDAQEDLSVQVHPDDAYVRQAKLGAFGKDEAWYVLASESGRTACGLKEGIGRTELESAVRQNLVGDTIRYFDVAPGDVVHIPPGTVHALCSGVMIYEVQQSSDLTFRLWDYNRPGPDGNPRELHTERALDVIAYEAEDRRPRPWRDLAGAAPQAALLVDCPHYRLQRFSAGEAATEHRFTSFAAVTVIAGTAHLSGNTDNTVLQLGQSALVPADRPFSIVSDIKTTEYLISSVP